VLLDQNREIAVARGEFNSPIARNTDHSFLFGQDSPDTEEDAMPTPRENES
jgi:hypothetical protein